MKIIPPVFLSVATMLFLTSCASTTTENASPCVQYVDCSEGMKECHEHAREICPMGYREIDDITVGPDFAEFAQAHFNNGVAGALHMTVICNP
jgi:hypothetical protein